MTREKRFRIIVTIILALLIYFCFVELLRSQERYEIYCKKYLLELRQDSLKSQIGIKEKTGNNDGAVLKYQKPFGLRNEAYCQMMQWWAFWINAKSYNDIPIEKNPLAISSYYFAKKNGVHTLYYACKGDLIVFRNQGKTTGHVEYIDSVLQNGWVTTIAGNTSNGLTGNQREGNGVYYRHRNIKHPLSRILLVKGLVGFYSEIGKGGCNYVRNDIRQIQK